MIHLDKIRIYFPLVVHDSLAQNIVGKNMFQLTKLHKIWNDPQVRLHYYPMGLGSPKKLIVSTTTKSNFNIDQ